MADTTLLSGFTGNGNSSVAHRTRTERPGAVTIATTVGATPTVTVNIQGSADGATYFNIPYALVATPTTFVLTALTITTTVTTTYLLQADQGWQYLRLAMSANTNVTLSATAHL